MRRVLMIALYFPPIGEVGSKRPLTLVRHLPRHGWEPIVLAGNPAIERSDPGLAAHIPAGIEIRYDFARPNRRSPSRAPNGRPGRGRGIAYFDPFDRYLKALPHGLASARQMIREFGPQAIHVCADPWTSLFAGRRLALETGLPFVADLRDPWSLHTGKMAMRSPPTRWAIRHMESRVFRAASKIVLNTDGCRDRYVKAYAGRLLPDRFRTIRNAFDMDLYEPATPARPSAFTLLHYGDFRAFVSGAAVLRGFARFVSQERLGPAEARLVASEPARPEEVTLAQQLGIAAHVEFRPRAPYGKTLQVLRSADVLVLCNDDDAPVIPSKLYDYLAARRPVLSLSTEPESNRIVVSTGSGLAPLPHDPDAVAEAIRQLRERTRGPQWGALPADLVSGFTATTQAEQFAAVLDEVTAG